VRQRFLGAATVIAVVGTSMGLAGCGSSSGAAKDVTLKLVAADYGNSPATSSKKYWDALAGQFEAKNPGIKVDVDVRSWVTVDSDVAAMVKKNKAPDIAQIGSYADYAKQGKLYSADELLDIPTQSNFLTQLSDAGQVDQVQYGMPFVASTRLLFYNKKLFDQARVSPPKTWSDIKADAEALKQQGVPTPFALPLGPEEAQAESMMWMLSGGGGYTRDTDGSYDIDDSENINTFKWLQKNLVEAGLTGSVAPQKLNRTPAFKAFTSGKVGMLNGHPTLLHQAEKAGVKVGMVPLPGKTGPSKASMGVADWIMGFKQNRHAKEIGKFLDFVYDDKNVMKFVGQYDLLPVTYSANDVMAGDPKYKDLKQFESALPTSELPPVDKTSWSGVSENIKQEIGKAVEPGNSPASVLGAIARKATAAESAD
jgi:multiple sugar transport system substrate-binding protein